MSSTSDTPVAAVTSGYGLREHRGMIALTVMSATILTALDTTIANVALPHMQGSLSATQDQMTWALTSYIIAGAIMTPLTGWLADRFGRKPLFLFSVIGFTIASALCGMAQSLSQVVAFRLLQGLCGATLFSMSQAVLFDIYPKAQAGRAMAIWGMGVGLGPMLGPVIGGWLTDNYSWRWVFYINIPVGLASIIMTRLFIFDPPYIRRSGKGIDYWGIGMLALGIGALQVVLDKGQEDDWFASHAIVALTIASACGIVLFILRELMTRDPVVHLSVFRNRTYSAGVFLMTVVGFVLYGSMLLVPIFLQTLLGYSALEAGVAMAPRGLGSFLMMPVVGTVVGKFDPRKVLGLGLIGGAWSLYALSKLSLDAGYWDIFWP